MGVVVRQLRRPHRNLSYGPQSYRYRGEDSAQYGRGTADNRMDAGTAVGAFELLLTGVQKLAEGVAWLHDKIFDEKWGNRTGHRW